MDATAWFLVAGGVLVLMALAGSVLKRLPLSTSLLYLAVGVGLSPAGIGLIDIDLLEEAESLERITEIAVIISLFAAGLKLRTPLSDPAWRAPLRLAFVSMSITVGLIALVGVTLLGLSLGAAVLLGAILAPTDPVLASEVQVEGPGDVDRVRFGLTGEAGLNDGTAFPFVVLGLGLLGLHELGDSGLRWLAFDVVWAVTGGILIGAVLGSLIGRVVLYLRREHREGIGLDDFLGLGLIALSYGTALATGAYGFLAVFAAGLALRRVERLHSGERPLDEVHEAARMGATEEVATQPHSAPAYMAQAVLGFSEQLERMAEVAVVVLVGALVWTSGIPLDALWFTPLMLLAVRPATVLLGLLRSGATRSERAYISWFGIRGVGSIYYLTFAVAAGFAGPDAREVAGLVLAMVVVSVVVHGVSVTPLMSRYGRERAPNQRVQHAAADQAR